MVKRRATEEGRRPNEKAPKRGLRGDEYEMSRGLIQLAEIGRCHHVLGLEVAAEDVEVGEAAGGGHFADGHVGAFSEQAAGVLQAQAADELWQRLVTASLRKG